MARAFQRKLRSLGFVLVFLLFVFVNLYKNIRHQQQPDEIKPLVDLIEADNLAVANHKKLRDRNHNFDDDDGKIRFQPEKRESHHEDSSDKGNMDIKLQAALERNRLERKWQKAWLERQRMLTGEDKNENSNSNFIKTEKAMNSHKTRNNIILPTKSEKKIKVVQAEDIGDENSEVKLKNNNNNAGSSITTGGDNQKCKVPNLNPFHPDVQPFIKYDYVGRNCTLAQRGRVLDGVLHLNLKIQ